MPDPISVGIGGAIAAYLGKDGVKKLLGPTAEYLGEGLRDLAKKRVENIGRIFKNAETKLGTKKLSQAGQVPPKVLRAVLDEGSFSDDELSVEYFGGILASSRTEDGRDDRGARMARQLESLSTYQLRTHYLFYSTVRHVFAKHGLSMNHIDRAKMQLFIPFTGYTNAMEFSPPELEHVEPLFTHIFFGLASENLIHDKFMYGPEDKMKTYHPSATEGGIVCEPSAQGTELFLWAFGESKRPMQYLFDPKFNIDVDKMPPYIVGACPSKLPIQPPPDGPKQPG
jgi:hypothetical protein